MKVNEILHVLALQLPKNIYKVLFRICWLTGERFDDWNRTKYILSAKLFKS